MGREDEVGVAEVLLGGGAVVDFGTNIEPKQATLPAVRAEVAETDN